MNRNIIIANIIATVGATGFIASRVPPSAVQGLLMVVANPAITAGFSVLDRKISKDTSRKRIDELEKDLTEKSKEFDRLTRELELTKEDLAKLETTDGLFATKPVQREFNDLSHQIEQLNHELSIALHDKSELSDRLEEKHNDLLETEDNLLKMEAELLRIKENGGLQVQVAIRDRINAEREEALKSGMQAGVEQGNRKIDQLEGLSADLLGKVDYYSNLLGQTAEEIEELQTRIARDKAQLMNQSASELNARDRQLLQVRGLLDGNRVLRGTAEVERLGNKLHDEIESRYGIRLDIIDANRGATEDKFLFRREGNQPITIAEFKELVALAPEIRRSTGLYGQLTFNLPERGNKSLLEAAAPWREVIIDRKRIDRLATPWEKLASQIVANLNEKPTVRVMGATGDGKGVAFRSLLAIYCEQETGSYIRLHDPQHGSPEDYWGVAKASKSGSEMKEAIGEVANEMRQREENKDSNAPIIVDVFDEIDTQLTKEQKAAFPELISRIRHARMRTFLSGQNPKVSRAGLQWSDIEQMTCLYMMSSALDAIKNNPALETSKDKLRSEYDEISQFVQSENESFDKARKYRFGLCVRPGGVANWFILPPAEDIVIDPKDNVFLESMTVPKPAAKTKVTTTVDLSDSLPDQAQKLTCPNPECGSTEIASKGTRRRKNDVVKRYKCKSCGRNFSGS